MVNSVVIWGPDAQAVTALARAVALKTGRPLLESLPRSPGDWDGLLAQGAGVQSHVLALEPDSLLDRTLRLRVLESCTLISVRPTTVEATPLDSLKRPAYREAHLSLEVDGADFRHAAARTAEVWRRAPVAVGAAERSYCVEVSPVWPESPIRECLSHASSILFITDENVRPLHGDRALALLEATERPVVSAVMPAGEQHKTLGTASSIWHRALAGGIDRKSVVVALGGGVVTDVSGFVAASWMRGLSWVALPTTLLAMVDASVGGKTAVDLEQAKNAIGAFWQPLAVFCATEVLGTEPDRGYTGALAEVVKTALIGDPALFRLLEERGPEVAARDAGVVGEIVARCVRVKAGVVTRDPREDGLRASLNLGHTIGHALEADGGYSRLSHGEAVSLGLVAALHVGESLGFTPRPLLERTIRLLAALGLPAELDPAALRRSVALMAFDKKRIGRDLSFVVAHEVGSVRAHRIALDELSRRTLALADSLGG